MNLVLDLPLNCLVCPQRSDLSKIEVMMLWPKDPIKRAEAERTSAAAFGIENLAVLDAEMRSDLAKLAFDATPLREIRARVAITEGGPFVQGLMAGYVLFFALSRSAAGRSDAQMKSVHHDVTSKFSDIWTIKKHTVENVTWPVYRPVAHFWAAYRDLLSEHGTDYPFPCKVADLSVFLGLAESYRALGEVTRPRQSPTTILRPSETVQLPAGLPVPEFKLEFSPLDCQLV